MTIFFVGLAIGILLGYAVLQLIAKFRRTPYLATIEYWVYLPQESLPNQDEVFRLLLSGNSPVGTAEGILLSDIRLHVGLILRSKNPHVFRPDLIGDSAELQPGMLERFAASHAIAKIRYLSEEKLTTTSHLTLVPYLAYAYAKLGDSPAIYDAVSERMFTPSDFTELLKQDRSVQTAESHVSTHWKITENGGLARTYGLIKKGIPELETAEVHVDERLLVMNLLDEAVARLWHSGEATTPIEIESYNDRFSLHLSPPKDGKSIVRILRLQAS